MAVWWITIFSTYILCYLARYYSTIINVDGRDIYKPNKVLTGIAIFIMVMVSGLRSGIGDTGTYRSLFNAIPLGFKEYTWELITNDSTDKGFYILLTFIKNYISTDSQVFIFIFAVITITLIIATLYKYCGVLELAVFIFITAGNYVTTMNGIRQYTASAVLFLCFPLIYEKKWKSYFLIVLLAGTIHGSALFFIPLYFFVNKKPWGRFTMNLILLSSVAYIAYPVTVSIFSIFLENTQYSNYTDSILSDGTGSNVIRTLVAAIPIIMAYIGKDEIEKYEKYFGIVLHGSIFNLTFMLLSNAASWIFARYCMYFSLYSILLTCWAIKYGFKEPTRKIVYFCALFLYGLYFYYEMHISLGQTYASNYLPF